MHPETYTSCIDITDREGLHGRMAASTKPRRTKSARPDLMVTTNKELERQLMAEKSLDYSLSQRATSAHGNKRKSEGTGHVFPRQSRKDGDDDQLKTYYASQFEAKTVSADERQARPTSSTRRNNPHPQQVRLALQQIHNESLLSGVNDVKNSPYSYTLESILFSAGSKSLEKCPSLPLSFSEHFKTTPLYKEYCIFASTNSTRVVVTRWPQANHP